MSLKNNFSRVNVYSQSVSKDLGRQHSSSPIRLKVLCYKALSRGVFTPPPETLVKREKNEYEHASLKFFKAQFFFPKKMLQ